MSTCRSCQAPIRWVRTATNNKLMPLNLEPDPAGNVTVTDDIATIHAPGQHGLLDNDERWMPHHATCPDAAEWKGH